MEGTGGPYLNTAAVTSPVGIARLLQMTFGCTTFSLVAHQGGFSAAYGTFCMFVWTFCFAITVFILACEFTHLHRCLSISWGNFTAAFAMLAALMSCFVVTVVVVAFSVTGKTALLCFPFERAVVVYTFGAVLLYVSAASSGPVVWPVFCFDGKYGSPRRPGLCAKGKCPWDSQLVIAVFTYVNLLFYVLDLAYSQRIRFVPHL
ncbi:PREDICTED: LOW QUALITY PROTEIN: myeloid-associated differentiation marker-like protein 2 [Merops nubicus]|uniref:LOW QUALITY PROTEIN: myeloid-associated differentiation marker-like protein 2 n=1 Tax=Merops nubicus TaxID=57421 RepID=UPI0004F08E21|nr:PREDICTED: LOW QUALITY PROTEIN: myeloid-associated differentiation marker-like protein 2 [Merops nubicus]